MCYQPPVNGADPVRRPGAGCLALHSIDKQIGQGVDDVAAPRAAQTAAVEQPCRRVTESLRNQSNALGKAFRSGGTESSNPASSSSQSVSAVNREATGEKPRTLAAVCGWLGT